MKQEKKKEKTMKFSGERKQSIHTVALHDAQKFDDDFGGRANEDLAFATTLSVDNVVLCATSVHPIFGHYRRGRHTRQSF